MPQCRLANDVVATTMPSGRHGCHNDAVQPIILLAPLPVKHIFIANARVTRSSEAVKPERGTIPSNDGHFENNVRLGRISGT
jgi:hypothetical protein